MNKKVTSNLLDGVWLMGDPDESKLTFGLDGKGAKKYTDGS